MTRRRVLICQASSEQPTAERTTELVRSIEALDAVAVVAMMREPDISRIAQIAPDVIIAVGFDHLGFSAFRRLRAPSIWDMSTLSLATISALLDEQLSRTALQAAFAAAQSIIGVRPDVAIAVEDRLALGLPQHGLDRALAACLEPQVVIVGAGLGNMIYASSMIRWLAETSRTPVDLVIHDRFEAATALFAQSPWLNIVYPGFEYLAGRNYRTLISSVIAGAMRPPFSGERELWLDQEHSYNEEGRFIHETRLNFVGLERLYGGNPSLSADLPPPFIRDLEYSQPNARIVGVASGKKDGGWSKREWSAMSGLVVALKAKGWEVRSFGLPGEAVEGAIDRTGLPMRESISEIAKCAYFISYDGGLCHIAEGIGVPTIWLFGSTGVVKNGPVYEHSKALTSMRACGPCLYKIDWLRCETPDCMHDLTIDQVVAALDELHDQLTTRGYDKQPATLNPDVLDYELSSPYRPGPPSTWESYLRERLAGTSRDRDGIALHCLRLLRAGDILAFVTVSRAMATLYPEDVLASFFAAIAQATEIKAIPLPPPPHSDRDMDPQAVASAFKQLNLDAPLWHLAIELGARHWRADRAKMRAYIEGMPQPEASDAEPQQISAKWLPKSAPRISCDEVLSLASTLNIPTDAHRADLSLSLGLEQLPLRRHDAVLLIVPHIRLRRVLAGSTSSLIHFHARRLMLLGARPVVASLADGDIPEGLLVRDSVTFIQAHRDWSETDWRKVHDAFGATVCLDYDYVPNAAAAGPRMSVDICGLLDPTGQLANFRSTNQWDYPSPATGSGVSADQLSLSLMLDKPQSARSSLSTTTVTALVSRPGDFMALMQVASGLPTVGFRVIAPFVYRGIEKNIELIGTDPLSADALADIECLIQFSSTSSALSAEAINVLERGGRVVAAAPLEGPANIQGLNRPRRPTSPASWIAAITHALGG